MAKFRVKLSALVNAEATVVVDACSKEDAEQLAYSNNPDVYQWKLGDVYEVTQIEADSLVWRVVYNNDKVEHYYEREDIPLDENDGVWSIDRVVAPTDQPIF